MRGKFLKVITLNSKIDDWGGKIPTQFLNSLVRDAADAGGFASIFLGFQMQEFLPVGFVALIITSATWRISSYEIYSYLFNPELTFRTIYRNKRTIASACHQIIASAKKLHLQPQHKPHND